MESMSGLLRDIAVLDALLHRAESECLVNPFRPALWRAGLTGTATDCDNGRLWHLGALDCCIGAIILS